MKIRQATKQDSKQIAPLMYQAIHEIAYTLTGSTYTDEVLERLAMWVEKPKNRLSHENIWVADIEGEVAGMIISYRGDEAEALDRPIREWLTAHGSATELDVETEGFVQYIDSLAVAEAFGGRGIGTKLIEHIVTVAKERGVPVVTLNVDQENPAAHRLYTRLGFQKEKEIDISGARFDYMKKEVDSTPFSV
ncbi:MULTISPECIES: GNAT family N-acetyltransferase [unclassified Exiguobacterium]|uniref:GNAT family N-acetyltransferase n=1 Tax=unclassified Exiguobacterium TaxID=2644629 RepID=UPI001BEA4466|nr:MULTISPECIES: GNAT family N-acetyltransferase [unclassified Exiguobacterium]